jgi:hypothetical protein
MLGSTRYRKEKEIYYIDVHVQNQQQLFDYRDPAPFRERDLDEDFVKYVLSSLREIPNPKAVKLMISFPRKIADEVKVDVIENAIHTFFEYEVELSRRDMKLNFREGQNALIFALMFLSICVAISNFALKDVTGWLQLTFKEGLTVIGWVALWKPMNLFLYEWWPVLERMKRFEILVSIPVEIRFIDT